MFGDQRRGNSIDREAFHHLCGVKRAHGFLRCHCRTISRCFPVQHPGRNNREIDLGEFRCRGRDTCVINDIDSGPARSMRERRIGPSCPRCNSRGWITMLDGTQEPRANAAGCADNEDVTKSVGLVIHADTRSMSNFPPVAISASINDAAQTPVAAASLGITSADRYWSGFLNCFVLATILSISLQPNLISTCRYAHGMMTEPLHIVWFKRDLRIVDHRPLLEASRRGAVLPLLIIEPAYWREPDTSARQYDFMRETAAELTHALGHLGQPLILRVGEAVDVLETIRQSLGIAALWSHEETGNAWTFARDRAAGAWARHHSIPWHEVRQDGVVRGLQDRNGWARHWDAMMAKQLYDTPRALTPLHGVASDVLPCASELGLTADSCIARQTGGRQAGLVALESFLYQRGRDYRRAMSSPLDGAEACSRVSPYLAFGALSMRETAQHTWGRLRDIKGDTTPEARAWRGSMVSFSGRLHWHCHFMQKLESEPALEFRELHPSMRGLRPAEADLALLHAWAAGETGFPFLDACMRSLKATGWLNFRMRAMVTSFASYNLWQPWRASGLHLARQFTDYEPGIHWPQVQMQSGTTGINTIRIYNVVKQGYDQDPTGAFVRRWVPELAGVPDQLVHEPWRWDGATTVLGKSYPVPIVDLAASTKAAKDRVFAARGTRAFRDAADAIQSKHGSRKSGLPMTGQVRAKAKKPAGQMEFDL